MCSQLPLSMYEYTTQVWLVLHYTPSLMAPPPILTMSVVTLWGSIVTQAMLWLDLSPSTAMKLVYGLNSSHPVKVCGLMIHMCTTHYYIACVPLVLQCSDVPEPKVNSHFCTISDATPTPFFQSSHFLYYCCDVGFRMESGHSGVVACGLEGTWNATSPRCHG